MMIESSGLVVYKWVYWQTYAYQLLFTTTYEKSNTVDTDVSKKAYIIKVKAFWWKFQFV